MNDMHHRVEQPGFADTRATGLIRGLLKQLQTVQAPGESGRRRLVYCSGRHPGKSGCIAVKSNSVTEGGRLWDGEKPGMCSKAHMWAGSKCLERICVTEREFLGKYLIL